MLIEGLSMKCSDVGGFNGTVVFAYPLAGYAADTSECLACLDVAVGKTKAYPGATEDF